MDPQDAEDVNPRLPPNTRAWARTIWIICGLTIGAWSLLYLTLTTLLAPGSTPPG